MTLRRKSREFALQMLFEWDMAHQKPARIMQNFWKLARAAESTRKFADQLFEGSVTEATSSDKLVEKLSENWRRRAAAIRSFVSAASCAARLRITITSRRRARAAFNWRNSIAACR